MPGFTSKLSPEQWAEARRLRAEGASFVTIAKRFGMSPQAIATRARKDAWAAPGSVERAPARGRSRVPSPATADVRDRLALRFYSILDIQIAMLELRMKRDLEAQKKALEVGEPAPPFEDERETFAALVARFKQVTEIDSVPAPAADGRRRSVNPELTALSGEIEPSALAAASEKDESTARLAEQLAKAVGPA